METDTILSRALAWTLSQLMLMMQLLRGFDVETIAADGVANATSL